MVQFATLCGIKEDRQPGILMKILQRVETRGVFRRIDLFKESLRMERRGMLKVGAVYFALVFAVGWILGLIRELWIIPRFGRTAGFLIEAPIMLVAMTAAARWVIRRFLVSSSLATRLSIGLIATGFLVVAEIFGIWWMRGLPLSGYLATFDTMSGGVSVLLVLFFAGMPMLVERPSSRPGVEEDSVAIRITKPGV